MKQLGKYEILELIGSGATAEVFRAHDTVLDREVALKLLHPALVIDATAFERFLQEARAAAGLFHPNIATVLDTGEAEGRFYIAMRFVDGRSLDKILGDEGPLPPDEVRKMAIQIGGALHFAHQKGFLHRDVKPANIVRSADGDYILTDFGLVRAMMVTGLTTHTGAVLGTPAYIPPEIWRNQAATPAADQYALACVLYEALTGRILFDRDTPPAVMTAHVLDGPGSLSDVSTEWRGPLQHALDKDPQRRFADLVAFVKTFSSMPAPSDIRAAETPRMDVPQEKTEPPRPLPVERKRSGLIWLIGGGVAALVMICLLFTVLLPAVLDSLGQGGANSPMSLWTAVPTLDLVMPSAAPTLAPTATVNLQDVQNTAPPLPTAPPPLVTFTVPGPTALPTSTSESGPIPLIICRPETTGLCISSFGDVSGVLMINLRNSTDFSGGYALIVNSSRYTCRTYQINLKFLYCTGVMQVPNKSLYAELYELQPDELMASGYIVVPPIAIPTATPKPTDKPDTPPAIGTPIVPTVEPYYP